MGILAAMTFVRFGLEPLVKLMRRLFVAPGSWEKSSEYYILREVGTSAALRGEFCWLRHGSAISLPIPFCFTPLFLYLEPCS